MSSLEISRPKLPISSNHDRSRGVLFAIVKRYSPCRSGASRSGHDQTLLLNHSDMEDMEESMLRPDAWNVLLYIMSNCISSFFFPQEPLLIGDSDLHSLTSFTFFILSLKFLDSYNWE